MLKSKNLVKAATFAVASALSMNAFAAKVQVNWVSPENYSDILPGHTDSADKYQQRFFTAMEKRIKKVADDYLPADYTLAVAVYNVDMAGVINASQSYDGMKMTRLIGEGQAPSIELGFLVLDKDGKEVIKGADILREDNFRYRTNHSKEFFHEGRIVEKWFKKQLASVK